jgi:hypothetical protein
MVSRPKFEPQISWIWNRSASHSTTTFNWMCPIFRVQSSS